MKKMILIVLFITLSITAFSQLHVQATITGFPNGTKFYLHALSVDSDVDSALMKDNTVTLKGPGSTEPQHYWLCTYADKDFYYTVLFAGNDRLKVKGDKKDMPFTLDITGSKNQEDYNRWNAKTGPLYGKRSVLTQAWGNLKKDDSTEIKSTAIWKKVAKLDSAITLYSLEFIKNNLNTFAGIDILYNYRKSFSRDSLQHLYQLLRPSVKQSSYSNRIASYLKVGEPLKVGDTFADFELKDKDGLRHKVSDSKGKYILLDFSTAYCGPCILSVKDMHSLQKKYAGRLQILTVSCDNNKKTWLQSIERDRPTWLSVWDGKEIYSETALRYNVNGYPTFCVINPEGKIVSMFSGYGEGSLEARVSGLIK